MEKYNYKMNPNVYKAFACKYWFGSYPKHTKNRCRMPCIFTISTHVKLIVYNKSRFLQGSIPFQKRKGMLVGTEEIFFDPHLSIIFRPLLYEYSRIIAYPAAKVQTGNPQGN